MPPSHYSLLNFGDVISNLRALKVAFAEFACPYNHHTILQAATFNSLKIRGFWKLTKLIIIKL